MIDREKVLGNQEDKSITNYALSVAEQTVKECQALPNGVSAEIFDREQLITLVAYGVSIAERDLY